MVAPIVNRVMLAVLLFTFCPHISVKQEIKSASVTVTVADVRGNVVSNAVVRVLESSSKREQTQPVDEMGKVTLNVEPGTFDMTVTSRGFMRTVLHGVEIQPGEHRQFRVVLKVQSTDCCRDWDPNDPGIETTSVEPGNLVEPSNQGEAHSDLRKFLQNYTVDSNYPKVKEDTRYVAAIVHLRDDSSHQVIVYLIGGGWCGSGGCEALILVPRHPSSYSVLTRMTIAQLPIRILDSKSHGWHDLGVWVQGGGIQPGYEARLSFDGREYPSNPTVPPAQPLTTKVRGRVVVSYPAAGEPLFP